MGPRGGARRDRCYVLGSGPCPASNPTHEHPSMKHSFVRLALLAVVVLGFAGSAVSARADSHHYRHDSKGYWDSNHNRHDYVVRHGHRGFWQDRVWIQID